MTIPGLGIVVGYSRSKFRTGIHLIDHGIVLDAGLHTSKKVKLVLISHSHYDHIAELPSVFLQHEPLPADAAGYTKVPVVVPRSAKVQIEKFIRYATGRVMGTPTYAFDWLPMEHSQSFHVELGRDLWSFNTVKCYHPPQTLGYCASKFCEKLLPEFMGLSGKEIAALRKGGTQISAHVEKPMFAYLTDTTSKVFESNIVFNYPVIIVECTFLCEETRERARYYEHMHIDDLAGVINGYKNTVFVLIHFSERYDKEAILTHFKCVETDDRARPVYALVDSEFCKL